MEPLAIIDPRLPEEIVKNLHGCSILTIPVPMTELVEEPLAGHPDIQMFLHDKNLFVHPDIDISFLKKIGKYINIIQCTTRLSKTYPGDIPYNIACTKKNAFHKINSTDKTIAEYLTREKTDIINVNQGYAKCTTMIVDEQSIITSDKTINKAAENTYIDSLLITEGGINLPGYRYGFIGGASGRFHDTVYITGTLDMHPDRENIYRFIESKGMQLKVLSDEMIIDAGSIFFID